MAKEEKFTFLSADGKTTIHAVKWIPLLGLEALAHWGRKDAQ